LRPTEAVTLVPNGAELTLGEVEGSLKVLCSLLLILVGLVEFDVPALELRSALVCGTRVRIELERLRE
jgi:hypothetical protein